MSHKQKNKHQSYSMGSVMSLKEKSFLWIEDWVFVLHLLEKDVCAGMDRVEAVGVFEMSWIISQIWLRSTLKHRISWVSSVIRQSGRTG